MSAVLTAKMKMVAFQLLTGPWIRSKHLFQTTYCLLTSLERKTAKSWKMANAKPVKETSTSVVGRITLLPISIMNLSTKPRFSK